MKKEIFSIDEKNYEYIFNKYKNKIIIIKFFANWCLPCKKMSSVFKEICNDSLYKKNIFCSINIDNNKFLLEKFIVKTIPKFIILFNNNIIGETNGIMTLDNFKKFIYNSISNIK